MGMSRTLPTFQSVFDDLAARLGHHDPAAVAANASLQGNLLNCFNQAYNKGWTKRVWEDAWTGLTVSPSGGTVIAWGALKDARRFELWTSDPRSVSSTATRIYAYATGNDGIRLLDSHTTVFVLYMPQEVKFTTTAWSSATTYASGARVLYTNGRVYKSLQGSNTNQACDTETDYWVEEPLIPVLAEFTAAYARGSYLLHHQGQPDAGRTAREAALNDLDILAQQEFFRVAKNLWKPADV